MIEAYLTTKSRASESNTKGAKMCLKGEKIYSVLEIDEESTLIVMESKAGFLLYSNGAFMALSISDTTLLVEEHLRGAKKIMTDYNKLQAMFPQNNDAKAEPEKEDTAMAKAV